MLTNETMEDDQLVRKVLDGNRKAFLLLIEKYKDLVFHMVSRLVHDEQDKEELCQDVFMKVYDSLGTFRFQSKLSTWIATISYRMAVNHARKKNRNQETDDLDKVTFNLGADDNSFERRDFTRFVHHVVDQMPETYRAVLTLFYLDGFSYPEIVEITGMPEGTVKNYLFRARKKLKELMEPYVGVEIEI